MCLYVKCKFTHCHQVYETKMMAVMAGKNNENPTHQIEIEIFDGNRLWPANNDDEQQIPIKVLRPLSKPIWKIYTNTPTQLD